MCAWAQSSTNSTFSAGFSPHPKHLQLLGGITLAGIAVRIDLVLSVRQQEQLQKDLQGWLKAIPGIPSAIQSRYHSAARVIPMRHKGDLTGDRLVRSGQSFFVFSRLPFCHLCLHWEARIRPWLAQTVGSLSQPAGVWRDAPGRRQAWPF